MKPERVRRGRHRGGIYTSRSGERVFLAFKHLGDIFRNGASSISDAVRGEDAYWPIDEGLLMEMKAKGIRFCGVIVRETGDVYLTELAFFFGPERARLSHPWVRAELRYLNLSYFRRAHGIVKVR